MSKTLFSFMISELLGMIHIQHCQGIGRTICQALQRF